MSAPALHIKDLHVSLGDLQILKGVDLQVQFGELHAIMGPNGSGKSTLCHCLTGKPGYQATGTMEVAGVSLNGLEVHKRAQAGLLAGLQYPVEIPGLDLSVFVEEAAQSIGMSEEETAQRIDGAVVQFGMEPFLDRSVNAELSGGEKKRSEVFQIAVLNPKVVVLDEIDSGLDIDSVRLVAEAVQAMRGSQVSIVMITHYNRILKHVRPDRVHIMLDGRIVESGGPELADDLEQGGYEKVRERLGFAPTPTSTPTGSKVSDIFTDTPFDL